MRKPTERQLRAGQRMEEAARAKGWNAYDVALALGVRPPTVYRWFRGIRPGQELLERFAALVERPISDFYEEPGGAAEAAVRLLVQWADLLMAGQGAVQSIRTAGLAIEDLSALELSGLIASEEQLRADLTRASRGAWGSLSLEQRADIVRALAAQREADKKADDPPAPNAPRPKRRRPS